MRVKRLEVQGFKSFKDKTVIHFDHGITGIVGPNGCGKSNIVDAFFWVMGEQSYKHIRGTGSDDLIFNGSSKYAPLGFAEATIVMETDFADTESAAAGATAQDIPLHLKTKEISVTRRVYRDGHGEYMINGVQARLKDIHELFMDTGVGAKGYSVIEQGQIGKIVNSKPEDRRLLVEEAAGIAKYKARKRESIRKMEATQSNLARLTDVINEIERSLGSLERQAQKARNYKKLKDELLDKELTWGRRKAQILREKLEQFKLEKEAVEQELLGLRAELQIVENSIETDRVAQLDETKAAEDLQVEIQNLSGELAQEKSSLDLSRKRQEDLELQLKNLNEERSLLSEAITAESEAVASQEHELISWEQVFAEAAARLMAADVEARDAREKTDLSRKTVDQVRRNLIQNVGKSSELHSKDATLLSRIESAQAQLERLSQHAESIRERVQAAHDDSEMIQTQTTVVSEARETLRTAVSEQKNKIEVLETSVHSSERAREEAVSVLTQVQSKLQSLEELAAAHEGFGDGPRAILDFVSERGESAQLRALADAVDVDHGYEVALEGWLEDGLQGLYSENPALALESLQKIRNDQQGRAAIHVSGGSHITQALFAEINELVTESGFEVLGQLENFVHLNDRVGEQAKSILSCLLHNVCVVRNFDAMSKFISSGQSERLLGWSLVSLDGFALDQFGALRGGTTQSDQSAVSVLGRKRAIQALTEKTSEAQLAVQSTESQLEQLRADLNQAEEHFEVLKSELQTVEMSYAALEKDLKQSAKTSAELEAQLESNRSEVSEAEARVFQAQADREAIREEVEAVSAQKAEFELAVSNGETELLALESHLREAEGKAQSLRVEEASLKERSQSLKRELDTGKRMLSDRQRRNAEIEKILERAQDEFNQHSGSDSSIEEKIGQLTQALEISKQTLSEVKCRLEVMSAQVNQAMTQIKELHHQADLKATESSTLALDAEKYQSELSFLVQNLEEKYGPNCLERPVTSPIQEEMTEPVVTREMTAEEEKLLGEEVERIREKIRKLGDVNPEAVEQYEEMKTRYDYLTGERSDLELSIQNLNDAIDHINKTSEERFRKAFEAIAHRFAKLFPIIFGGGSAELTLVYPEGSTDILEAGVEIMAQPPGKKVSSITLLSGGEKALTAISLIFAIFMVKPSPFCVLDEVDAPLDDSNVGKFNAILREMAQQSQFIVISHNKKTMELNDALYGVTMEEPGVSKIMSVEMR